MIRAGCALLTSLLVQEGPPAQSGVPFRPVVPVDFRRPEANLAVDRKDERIRRIVWSGAGKEGPPVVIPMATPVTGFEAGLLPGGDTLVLLAGGVKDGESLDLYVADRMGRLFTFRTGNGTRLGPEFGGGLGSWPLADGVDVLLFAYLREGRIEFRAIDLSWSDPSREFASVILSRTLPASGSEGGVTGFSAISDPSTNLVRVRFAGSGSTLEFAHPLGPRPRLDHSLIDFGDVSAGALAARSLRVRNEGRSPLRIEASVHAPFAIEHPFVREVPPGGSTEFGIAFHAEAPGSFEERLRFATNSAAAPLAVPLRARAVQAPSLVAPGGGSSGIPSVPARVPGSTAEPGQPPAAPVPLELRFERVTLTPLSGGDVLVEGICRGTAGSIELRVDSSLAAKADIGEDGVFSARIRASPDQVVEAVLPEGERTRVLGVVPPSLLLDGGDIEIRGRPDAAFRLFAVELAPGGEIECVEREWQGLLDPSGCRRIPRAELGPDWAALVALFPGRDRNLTPVLRLPSGPAREENAPVRKGGGAARK
ncbi:MAG: hypothetical protein Fur0037_22750 [Planctomycetota bacterium]